MAAARQAFGGEEGVGNLPQEVNGGARARRKCCNGVLDCENDDERTASFHSNTNMCWTCARSQWQGMTDAQVKAKADGFGLKLLKPAKAAAPAPAPRTNAPRLCKTTEVSIRDGVSCSCVLLHRMSMPCHHHAHMHALCR